MKNNNNKDKVKIEKIMTRTEAANFLRELANQVEAGTVVISDTKVELPNSFECEFKFEVEDQEKELEVEFSWKE